MLIPNKNPIADIATTALRLTALFVLPQCAIAQTQPDAIAAFTRPLRFIVPNAPGGPTDATARLVGAKLAERIGVPVIIDNRPGASGTVGGELVARSAPDGHTLLLASSSAFMSTPILMPKLPFDGRRDFAMITAIVSVPYLLMVHPNSGPASVKELIALAKAKPRTLNFGSSGNGSTSHLVTLLFNTTAGIDTVHVPYKGSAPAAIDLIGGQLQYMFEAVAGGMQYLKSGRLRILGITSARRLSTLPDLPTIAEATLPGFEASVTHGICASAKTPAAMIARLNRELVASINTPEIRERLVNLGAEVIANSPQDYHAATQTEVRRWENVVRSLAAQPK